VANDVIDAGADLLIVGDMGIGNTTAAAALIAKLTESDAATVCGRGTGIDDATWMRKVAAIRDALWRCRDVSATGNPMEVMRLIGGADLAVMATIMRQASLRGVPVILDGVVVTAAALVAEADHPGVQLWWLAGHRSVEPGHTIALEHLQLDPVLDLGMRLGEGSGALMALGVLQQALSLATNMATFAEAAVTEISHTTEGTVEPGED